MAREAKDIDPELVRSLLRYEPESGKFFWRLTKGSRHANTEAGTLTTHGYIAIMLDQQKYQAHRLAWAFMTGISPAKQIDHINGDRLDNRWTNLREATSGENHYNAGLSKRNRSGFKGVGLHRGLWRAKLNHNGKCIHVGYFKTAEEAHAAYCAAARQHHGEFANFGRKGVTCSVS